MKPQSHPIPALYKVYLTQLHILQTPSHFRIYRSFCRIMSAPAPAPAAPVEPDVSAALLAQRDKDDLKRAMRQRLEASKFTVAQIQETFEF